ncbi:MAG: DNA polymerase III subunit beta [Oscillospiraceae bacterium]|nr:DNA polymerase III subunit beta [Oscillospiraceae bacterium]
MRFHCQVMDLIAGLSTSTRALAARSTMPILEGLLLETCAQGLRLTCTDLALGIETVVPAQVSEEGRIVLPGRLFSEIVRKLPGGEMELSTNDTFFSVIRCQNSRTNLAGLDPLEYPELPQVEDGNLVAIPQNALRSMIQTTCFAIATDETRPILTGCLLEISPEEVRLVALDGFRLALRRMPLGQNIEPTQAVIPGKVLSELAKVLPDTSEPASLNIGRTHLTVDMGDTRVVTRLLEGEYIRYRQILPEDWQTRVKVRRADLENAIERASLIAREGKNNLVRFHVTGEQLLLTSNAELGDVQEDISIYLEGKDIDIAFNVRYISDVLKILADDEICLRFNTNVSPCVICPPEGDDYTYLVLPVRVFNA